MNKKKFIFNFLENPKKFLLLDKNLDSSLVGVKLSDCLNFNPNFDKGIELNAKEISNITKLIYESFCGFLETHPKFNLENSKIFIYAITKTKDFNTLFVYKIVTKKIKIKRKSWIKMYSQIKLKGEVEVRLCCIEKFIPRDQQNIELDEKSLQERNKKLDQSCCFPGMMIDTKIGCSGYLLNSCDLQIEKYFLETDLIFDIIPYEKVSKKKTNLLLAINNYKPPDFPSCSDLYTELNVKNMGSFIKDCLITCYDWQHGLIQNQRLFEHECISDELLYFTIEEFN
jgi:hypothetical protein